MRKTNRIMANCHPDKPHVAKGLCNACYCKSHPRPQEYQKNWYERNREGLNEKRRAFTRENPGWTYFKQLEYRYGLTKEKYDTLYGNGCWLCGEKFNGFERPHIDHDHRCCSGKRSCGKCVRGLAHRQCNHASQLDDIFRLKKIVESLERYYATTRLPDKSH